MRNDAAIPVAWGARAAPFVYADQLGPGGRTARRWAEVEGSGHEPSQNPCDPRGTHDCPDWQIQLGCLGLHCDDVGLCHGGHVDQLGQVNDAPAWWPPGVPYPGDQPPAPGDLPQIVSAEECERRELASYDRGRTDEQRNTVKVAAISTAVSVVVAGAIGYLIGR